MQLEELSPAPKFSILKMTHCFVVSTVLNLKSSAKKLELQAELFRPYPNLFRKSQKCLLEPESTSAIEEGVDDASAPFDERSIECEVGLP